ncbi:MAG: hypothetical protein UHO61_00475 [Acutalibacteraceae bacterium]|nr:hypothetical protein [Acutalibacteraceae bacterium]
MDNNKIDKEKLMDAVISSTGGKIDKKTLSEAAKGNNIDALLKNLSGDDREKLKNVMSDKKSMEAALNTPQAKALLKAFLKGGGKNG